MNNFFVCSLCGCAIPYDFSNDIDGETYKKIHYKWHDKLAIEVHKMGERDE